MKVLLFALLLAIAGTAAAAEFTKFSCQAGGCQARIQADDRIIGVMWNAQTSPAQEFMGAWLYTPDGTTQSGHEYTFISANGNTLTIGFVVDATLKGKATAAADRIQHIITATRAPDGIYSFVPPELVGIGRMVMKASPREPGMFVVDVRLNP